LSDSQPDTSIGTDRFRIPLALCGAFGGGGLQPGCMDEFELVSRSYQNKSTVVTTNRAFADWGEVFLNAACVVSLIDRLMHRAEVVRIDGGSFRVKETKEREAQRKVERSAKDKSAMPRVQKGGE